MSKKYKKNWDNELSNNPSAFTTKVISTHATRLEALEKEFNLQWALKVVPNCLYINGAYAVPQGSHGYGRSGTAHPMYGVRGKKHPSYGVVVPLERREKIAKNHADCSGANNSRAKTWKLTSPTGVETICNGTIEIIAANHNIGIQLLRKHLGKTVPPVSRHATHPMSKNTVGWKLEIMS
jgi:hypothetical protein